MRSDRRVVLRALAGLGLLPLQTGLRAQDRPARLAAAWESSQGPRVGLLNVSGTSAQIAASIELPSRAHGLLQQRDGSLLVVARRPGDWLLRWHPRSAVPQWQWAEPDRAFTGHVLASADGTTLYTPETDLASGQGLIGVREARSLAKRAEWPTAGLDPHELLWDAEGRLIVANGGIATRPESGRRKLAQDRMDPSLVRLAADSGELMGQWRLPDPRLSIRHLAWTRDGSGLPVLGIALQAEHDDAVTRAAAPVLARFDGHALSTADTGRAAPDGAVSLAGYGGDIAAQGGVFAVSCPRAGGVGLWRADGRWIDFIALRDACALATSEHDMRWWLAGRDAALMRDQASGSTIALPDLKLDNHWIVLG